MDVVIDGRPEESYAPDGSVTDVLGCIVDGLREQGRALVALNINGEQVLPDTLHDHFAETPAADASIEVTTRPLRELVIEALDVLSQTLPELPEACRKLAQVFQSDTPQDGFEPFNELARIWEFVKEREEMAANALDVDFATLQIQGLPVSDHARELNSFLSEAAQALRDGDTILLGDLLEYELAPRAELEADLVAALRQHAEAAAR